MNPVTLIILGTLAHLAVTGWALAHCLDNCNTNDKTAYVVVIIFFPVGWIIYWILKPYAIPDEYHSIPKGNTSAPVGADHQSASPPHVKKENGNTEELLKPHTKAPGEQQVVAEREAAKAKVHAPAPVSQTKPPPAKPIHIIAQERKTTQPPFPPP